MLRRIFTRSSNAASRFAPQSFVPTLSRSSSCTCNRRRLFSSSSGTHQHQTDHHNGYNASVELSPSFDPKGDISPVKLNFQEYPGMRTGAVLKPALVIVHGLMGHLNNWRNIAGKPELGKDRRVFAVDLRNHGTSPWSPYWSLPALAEDLVHFLDSNGIPQAVVLGHSLGGKVAMQTALTHPERVSSLVVVDIAPVTYEAGNEHMDEIFGILSAINRVDLSNGATRANVDEQLRSDIKTLSVRQFLITNLVSRPTPGPKGETLRWRPNIRTLLRNYDQIRGFPSPSEVPVPFTNPALFIRGAKSGFVPQEAEDAIEALFPSNKVVTIPDAGHWVHHEKPAEFLHRLGEFLKVTDTHHHA